MIGKEEVMDIWVNGKKIPYKVRDGLLNHIDFIKGINPDIEYDDDISNERFVVLYYSETDPELKTVYWPTKGFFIEFEGEEVKEEELNRYIIVDTFEPQYLSGKKPVQNKEIPMKLLTEKVYAELPRIPVVINGAKCMLPDYGERYSFRKTISVKDIINESLELNPKIKVVYDHYRVFQFKDGKYKEVIWINGIDLLTYNNETYTVYEKEEEGSCSGNPSNCPSCVNVCTQQEDTDFLSELEEDLMQEETEVLSKDAAMLEYMDEFFKFKLFQKVRHKAGFYHVVAGRMLEHNNDGTPLVQYRTRRDTSAGVLEQIMAEGELEAVPVYDDVEVDGDQE